jgi:hypothetical protein
VRPAWPNIQKWSLFLKPKTTRVTNILVWPFLNGHIRNSPAFRSSKGRSHRYCIKWASEWDSESAKCEFALLCLSPFGLRRERGIHSPRMHVLITHLCAWGDDADNGASISGWKLSPTHNWIPNLQLLRLQDERITIQYSYFTYIVATTFLPTRSKRLRVLCWNVLMGE